MSKPRPQRAVRPKPVKMWCAWEPGWYIDLGTMFESRELARHQAILRGWDQKYVVQVTITRAVRGKGRK